MAFGSHAEQDQIEARELAVAQLEMLANGLSVFLCGLLRFLVFTFHPKNLLRLQRRLRDHRLRRHVKVALRIVWADVTLVAEKDMHLIPWQLRVQRKIAHQQAVKGFWRGAAGENEIERALLTHRFGGDLDEELRRALGDGGAIGEYSYVRT